MLRGMAEFAPSPCPQLADIARFARRLPELELRETRGIASEYVGFVIGHGTGASVSATVEVKLQVAERSREFGFHPCDTAHGAHA